MFFNKKLNSSSYRYQEFGTYSSKFFSMFQLKKAMLKNDSRIFSLITMYPAKYSYYSSKYIYFYS